MARRRDVTPAAVNVTLTAVCQGARVRFREGPRELVGTVLELQPSGMARVGLEKTGAEPSLEKLVPLSEISVL